MRYTLFFLFFAGCCCSLPSSDTAEWDQAVAREKRNQQIYALEAGTVNVWELEVSFPEGWTQADEDAAVERATLRELRRLQDLLKPAGVDVGDPQALPPPLQPRALRPAYRVRFSTLFPEVVTLAAEGRLSDGRCEPCRRAAKGIYAMGFGSVPVDLQTVTRIELQAGVKLKDRAWYESIDGDRGESFMVPPEGQVQLRLVESCPAKLVRVTQSTHVSNGSGVIATPRYEDRAWYEVRDAKCADGGGATREELGPTFQTGRSTEASGRRLMRLRHEGQRLGVY